MMRHVETMGGNFTANSGNMSRALKRFMISAGAECNHSLKAIRKCFMNGHATKDNFGKALHAHEEANDEMRSDQRNAARNNQ